jgi:DNA-binding NtrC family response regulator
VALLVQFLITKFAARVGKHIDSVGEATMRRLTSYHWPGNIRELENILERAIILSSSPVLQIEPEVFGAVPPANDPVADVTASIPPDDASLEAVERNHVLGVLTQTNWVIDGPRGAAKRLNIHPNTLRSRLKKMGLERASQI